MERWSVIDAETGLWAGICPNHTLQLYSRPQVAMTSTDKLTAVRRAISLSNEFYPRTFKEKEING